MPVFPEQIHIVPIIAPHTPDKRILASLQPQPKKMPVKYRIRLSAKKFIKNKRSAYMICVMRSSFAVGIIISPSGCKLCRKKAMKIFYSHM